MAAACSCGSALNKNAMVKACLNMRACCYLMARLSVTAVDKNGFHSRNRGYYSIAKRATGCRYTPVRSSVSSRFPTSCYFRNPPMAAGLHARMALLGLCHSDDSAMRCRIPGAHDRDP
jgi:hypothetical protein